MSLSLASTMWALSATGAASVGGYALYSGFLDNESSTESVRGEEYVNVASPEFGAAFHRIAEGHPLPAGADYTRLYDNIVDTGGLMQLTGTAGQVVLHSICAWSGEWVRAHEADDSQAERNAVVELERAVSSPDLAAIDGGGWLTAVPPRKPAARRSGRHCFRGRQGQESGAVVSLRRRRCPPGDRHRGGVSGSGAEGTCPGHWKWLPTRLRHLHPAPGRRLRTRPSQ